MQENDMLAQLERLSRLKEQGDISADEYEALKRRVLAVSSAAVAGAMPEEKQGSPAEAASAPLPPPGKKQGSKGLQVFLSVLALIALFWGCSRLFADPEGGAQVTPKPAPSSTTSAPATSAGTTSVREVECLQGKKCLAAVASSVTVAIADVRKQNSVGSNPFLRATATGGATFVLVTIWVQNGQQDAITVDSGLFKLIAEAKEFSASSAADLALSGERVESLFLKQINPGLTVTGMVVFEVPASVDLANAQLQFRGGMTGQTARMPLRGPA